MSQDTTTASFLDALDAKIGDDPSQGVSPASPPSAAPAPEGGKVAPTAEGGDKPAGGVVVPASITNALAGATEPKKETTTADKPLEFKPLDADREKQLDDLFSTKAGEAFKATKTQIKEQDATIAKLIADRDAAKAELDAAKAAGANKEEIEKLRQDAEAAKTELESVRKITTEYERELAVVKVEATQEYKAQVTQPMNTLLGSVKSLAERYKVSAEELTSALAESDEEKRSDKLTELLANFREADRMKLYGMVDTFGTLQSRAKSVRENAATALKLIEQQRELQINALREQETQAYDSALDLTWTELGEKLPVFREVEGNDDWNTVVKGINTRARGIDIDKLPPKQRAEFAYLATAAGPLFSITQHYAAEVARLTAEVARLTSGKPGSAEGNPGGDRSTIAPTQGKGFLDSLDERIGDKR